MIDYSKEGQLKEFWKREAMPVITRLLSGQYRVTEIQKRFLWVVGEIIGKYGVPLNIDMSFVAPKDRAGKNLILPIGCHFAASGRPEATFFVPVFKMIFQALRSSKPADFRKIFERDLVIGLMHELDHLVQGIIADPTRVQVVDAECLAQAATCEHTIRVFVENNEELSKDDMLLYSTWVKGGRNVDSKDWRDLIAKMYGSLTRGPT